MKITVAMNVFITKEIPAVGIKMMEDKGISVSVWSERRNPTAQEIIAACAECDGMISVGAVPLDDNLLKSLQHLKVIALHGVGYDNVDIEAATKYGIPVSNTPDVLNDATADTAFLLMLATARKAFYMHKKIMHGEWGFSKATDDLGIDVYGKTLGIFGLGNIGAVMAQRCRGAFDMDIIYHNRNRNLEAERELNARYVSFEELLAGSDVLSVHASLSKSTANKFDYAAFRQMKKSAIFINTARGGLHNEGDLIKALEEQEIWGAGLDVTNPEPMSADSPLLSMPTVCVLPHIGSATVQTRDAMSALAAQNIIAAFNDEKLPTVVNDAVYSQVLSR